MNSKKYTFWYDSGHGWLEVEREEVVALGILGEVSSYSYEDVRRGKVFLEEDCDAGLFINIAKIGREQIIEREDKREFIRSLPKVRGGKR